MDSRRNALRTSRFRESITVPGKDPLAPACTRQPPGTVTLPRLSVGGTVPRSDPLVPARTHERPGTMDSRRNALRTSRFRESITVPGKDPLLPACTRQSPGTVTPP